jgi:Bacterial archaeo-eukaryotic release factor family 10
MTSPVVGLGTLRRLAELEWGARPVLSVYVSLDRAAVRACEVELAALATGPAPGRDLSAIGCVRDALRSMPTFASYGTRGLALFSSNQVQPEVVPLPERTALLTVFDVQPWLEPLAGMFCPGESGVAVVDRRRLRLFRGGERGLVEFAVGRIGVQDRQVDAHNSQRQSRLLIDGDRCGVARRLAGLLYRADGRRAFETIVIAAPRELWPSISATLPEGLRARLAGLTELDLQEATAQEINRALKPLLRRPAPSDSARPRSTATGDHAQGTGISQERWPGTCVIPLSRMLGAGRRQEARCP